MILQLGVKAIIQDDNKYLFIRRSDKYNEITGIWDIPGGRINFGEEPNDGLKREVFEETGLELKKIIRILDTSTVFMNEEKQIIRITYLCSIENSNINLSEEHTEARWFNLDEINFKFKDDLIEKCVNFLK